MTVRPNRIVSSFFALLVLLLWEGSDGVSAAGPVVHVVIDQTAPRLERTAADELAAQFKQLVDANVVIGNTAPEDADHVILLGSPATNPAVEAAVGESWPALSDQGLVIKSLPTAGAPRLVVGGGSPVATLWAVYELGYRQGVRYLLRRDVFPDNAQLKLTGFDEVMEPALRTRTWNMTSDLPIGPASWALSDHRRLLGQLAKMKFNRVLLSVDAWQPYVDYAFRGVVRETGVLWYGETYRVDGETPGKTAFGGADVFQNQDLAAAKTYSERVAAGTELVHGLIDAAHELGMGAGLVISPLEFPPEFSKVLTGTMPAAGGHDLAVRPGGGVGPADPILRGLAGTQVKAYLETYPDLDVIYLSASEVPEWAGHIEQAWKALTAGRELNGISLDDFVAADDPNATTAKSQIVVLALLRQLIEEMPAPGDRRHLQWGIAHHDSGFDRTLDRLMPAGVESLHGGGVTARQVWQQRERLPGIPVDKVPSNLALTLADDRVGILSQLATRSIEPLVGDLRRSGWDGFATRCRLLAELDATVHFLSRASFDSTVTARSAHDDLFTTISGKAAVADRLWRGFGHIEEATNLIDENDPQFARPAAGMLLQHYRAEPIPDWWETLTDHYTQAMIELYRSHDATHPRGRPTLFYYAKRSEYVLEYVGSVKAVREAAIAQEAGDVDLAIEKLEVAMESLYNALDTLSDIARDPSDRGLIALLAAHAYRPLLAEYERLLDAAEAD